ncbi:MAG: hypothetical protein AN485_11145 [Anabaena sp. MDT14b]|jgi:hypothetical protein|nr:MAG: hypothetical protein AN485_11145 [Anabaena sp. MDT14b]
MSEAVLDQQQVIKRNISQLLSQLTNTYQNTRSERKEIVTQFPPENEEFSLLEEIELLTVNLRGYASQIAVTSQVINKDEVISQLQAMRVFSVSQVGQFYFNNNGKYEQIKNYIRMLDYLRLLLLEYLQSL